MDGVAVDVKQELPFAWDLSVENWILSDVFDWLYLIQCLTSSSSMDHLVFDATSSNINEVLSINPSANVFAFGDFNVHQRLANSFWWNW